MCGARPPRLAVLLAGALSLAACGLDVHPIPGDPGAGAPPPVTPEDPEGPPSGPPATPPPSNAPDAGPTAGPRPGPTPQPMPGPTGDQLVIGGRAVPREKVVVFVHIGHSNMAGRTNTPRELRPLSFETHPQLWSFSTLGQWQPAKEPLSGDVYTKGRAGPGMSILRTALAMAPGSFMVSIGKGQDGSRGGECKAFRRGGLLYEVVMGPARQLKGKVIFGGIFSMLVLMDIFDKPNLPRANECMEAVARDMREDLGDPNIPFVMSDWEMGATGQFNPTLPSAMLARERLRVAQMNIRRSVIVPTDGLPMSDDHHFDLTGYKMWAERAFALMREAGWTTWAGENL